MLLPLLAGRGVVMMAGPEMQEPWAMLEFAYLGTR